MRQRLFLLTILTVILTLMANAAPNAVGAAPGGNSSNAYLCQHDGWQQLQGTDGIRFSNQGDCVSYAAHGGTLIEIPTTPVVQMIPDGGEEVPCSWLVTGTGFQGQTTYHYQVFLNGTSLGPGFDIMTDANGYFGTGFGMEPGNSAQYRVYLSPDLTTPVAVSNIVSC